METDTRITFKGGQGDDTLNGGAGDDQIKGGRGNDMLVSGTGDDMMIGGRGHDAFVFTSAAGDRDRASGGSGNDIFIDMSEGHATWTGGAGKDLFVIGVSTTMSGNPEGFTASGTGGTTVITDFSTDDVLIFSGVSTSMSGNPEGIWTDMRPGATLADWDGDGANEFVFRATPEGLEIGWGEEEVLLTGLSAADISLDQIHFGGFGLWDASTGTSTIAHSPAGSTLEVRNEADASYLTSGLDGGTWESIMFETFIGFGVENGL